MLSSPLPGALTSQTQGTHQKSLKTSLALETRSENLLSAGHTSSVIFLPSVLQKFSSIFSCFQIDDIFGGAAVNGKENGSAAPTSQPNRVRRRRSASFHRSPARSLCVILCASADVADAGGETAFGEGAGAGSQTEEPAAISATGGQTICRLQHPGDVRTFTGLTFT